MKKRFAMLILLGVLSVSITAPTINICAEDGSVTEETGTETTSVEKAAAEPTEETSAQETEKVVQETSAPETSAPETTAPETTTPEITSPETTVPETTVPETSAPETAAPETAAQTTASTPAPESTSESVTTETATEITSPETEQTLISETTGQGNNTKTASASEKDKDKNGTKSAEDTGSSSQSETGPTEVTEATTSHTSGGTVAIVGFSLDPSKYPAANINETTETIYEFLTTELGLNHAGACGVLANIQLESNFSPTSLGDGGSSYGICQWHNERFNALIAHCNRVGMDYNTLSGQLSYMEAELINVYPSVLAYVKNVPDTAQGAYDAAHYWCVNYEIPDNTSARAAQRGNLAMNDYFYRSFEAENDSEAEQDEKDALAAIKSIHTRMDLTERVEDMAEGLVEMGGNE